MTVGFGDDFEEGLWRGWRCSWLALGDVSGQVLGGEVGVLGG